MAPKAPADRGFTVAEKRGLLFERIALYVVFLVALIAMIVSFVALTWLGGHMRLSWAAPLIPLMIDGFGVACSVGIVRSQASGEPAMKRASEWMGLAFALTLSILGNVYHVLDYAPQWLLIAVASAIPVIVAYGIHVYGRAMSRGLSAHVMADDPDKLVFDVRHLGDEDTLGNRPARTVARTVTARTPVATGAHTTSTGPSTSRAQQPAPARTDSAQETAQDGASTRAASSDLREQARALFDAAVKADALTKPDAATIHRTIGATHNPATTRRWVQGWWDELETDLGASRPEVDAAGEVERADERVSA